MHVDALDIAIIGLLLIISAVGIATRSSRVPYPVALIIAGLALGALLHSPLPYIHDLKLGEVHLTPHLILVLFLPALLFEATLHIEAAALRQTLLPIGLLAIPGVLLTAAIVGPLIHWGVGLDWPTALLFGAIVAATDPIAVLAIFKRSGVPHHLAVLVEGESLFNDGTAVVLARILLATMLAGTVSVTSGVVNFIVVVGGGLVIGSISGAVFSRLTARLDDHLIEITLTTILTYGTFVVAEVLGVSGVIAVVAAGLILGNVGARHGMSPTTRLALLTFWEYVAFLLNSAVFLLIGLEVNVGNLLGDLLPVTIAIGAVLLARAVVVYGLGLLVLPLPPVLPRRWLHVLFWAGLRGAVSLAVVLSLPLDLPARPLLLNLTFGVVLFTLLVQALTMAPLIDRLGLADVNEHRKAYQARRAQLMMLRAAWHELQRMEDDAVLPPHIYAQLDDEYRAAGQQIRTEIHTIYHGQPDLEAEELQTVRTQLLRIERVTLQELQRQAFVDPDTVRGLAAQIDARMAAAESNSDMDRDEDGTQSAFTPPPEPDAPPVGSGPTV